MLNLLKVTFLFSLFIFLTGCGEKINKENCPDLHIITGNTVDQITNRRTYTKSVIMICVDNDTKQILQ